MEHLTILIITLVFCFTSPTQIMADSHSRIGFSLELIHRDSIHSPLYPGNLTSTERTKRLLQFSKSRVLARNASSAIEPQAGNIQPIIDHDVFLYTVRVKIGSPPKELHLLLDTDSSLVWTQCEPCTSCFPQDDPMYKPGASSSFRLLPCNHPLCVPPYTCLNHHCLYDQRYEGNAFTKGALATELFTFGTRNGQVQTIPNLVFGCSRESSTVMLSKKVSGILGMDLKEISLITQLRNHITGPLSFSYCFPRDPNAIGYLRFGNDIIRGRNLQSTPILQRNFGFYHIELQDVSVNGHRLHLRHGIFRLSPDGRSGGCTTDSGSSYTFMVNEAYHAVKDRFINYFRQFNLQTVDGRDLGMDLCYARTRNFMSFPNVDYHFAGGANLRVLGENVFEVMQTRFCLMMVPDHDSTIIGAAHQRNVQFVYDLSARRVSFGPANCAQV